MVSDELETVTTDLASDGGTDGLPAGTPSIHALLEVVRDALHDEVAPVTADRPQYVVRMACRLLEIIQRELDDGRRHAHALHERLRGTGAIDESDLATGLLAGRFDPIDASLREVIHELVRWRIAIARPDALAPAGNP